MEENTLLREKLFEVQKENILLQNKIDVYNVDYNELFQFTY
jgi:hypothetical protein